MMQSTTLIPVTRGGSTPIGMTPPTGSQLSTLAKTRSSMRPSQKIGIEMPKSEKVITRLSKRESGLTAATTPSGTPAATARTSDAAESCMVTGKAFHTSSHA